MRRVLVARLDSMGDVLLTGPAVRSVATAGARVTFLASSIGAPAAHLLPGVHEVMTIDAPWVLADPAPIDARAIDRVLDAVRASEPDQAVIFTSFHQSPLPLALLLRLAGVPRIGAVCIDYPGSLLDVRHHVDRGRHEVERNLSLVEACGYRPVQDTRLRVELPGADVRAPFRGGDGPVVVHPGAGAPARTASPAQWHDIVVALAADGHDVLVTGARSDEPVVEAAVRGAPTATVHDLDADLAGLARVLAGARAVVAGNTGPAHLAAAVGTPVVSVFPPTVPLEQWRPWGVPVAVLGNQHVACRGCRARHCPFVVDESQPCLAGVDGPAAVAAVRAVQRAARSSPMEPVA